MSEIEHKIDKSQFGDGPWQTEPDRVEWRYLGLPCLIVRNEMGALCGYVGVPPEHPWHGKDYNDIDGAVDVHGGLTYANKCNDAAICHVPKDGEPDDVWWLGFDCAHSGDGVPGRPGLIGAYMNIGTRYRDVTYVRAEVEKLAVQVAAKR